MNVEAIAREVLPKNATKLELSAAETILEALGDLPRIISTIWNSDTCPAKMLDHLAWAVSVDRWSFDWPDARKRRVIKAQPKIHRHHGTPLGVEEALKTLGYLVDIIEWWEDGGSGRRGTYQARVYVTDPIAAEPVSLDSDLVLEIRDTIRRAGAIARAFDVQIGLNAPAPTYVGAIPTIIVRAEAAYKVDPPPPVNVDSRIGVVPITMIRANANAE